ncbi:tetratricopeptide repeat protein [Sphingomonas sp.]|uniref:tetratricopeptide repeat protein n=1 Tax=Sphingomonas sp. TaxID=28214 RepID=UPI001D8885F6|nr:tetratricopeptide repeat protein [Sphingomonas sp.]MBX9796598.1 tetratricopeptide repeat protein [Sphingomonas sp.]
MPKLFKLGAIGAVAAIVAGGAVYAARSTASESVDPRAALDKSMALFNRGEATAARSWALKAARAAPRSGLAHAVLARTYLALGEGLAAQAELGRAKAAGFDMSRTHQLMAEALLLQGQPDRALAEAAKAPPRYAGYALRVAARALAAKRDMPGAQRLLAGVLAADGGKSAAAWADLARVRQLSGDIGGAIIAAGRALQRDPNNVDALTLRAELVRGQYGLVAAIPWFERALKVDPWRHDTLIEYAATLGDAGRYRAMLDATRRALAARPGSPRALYLQAVMAARAGNTELARSLLQRTGGGLDGQPGPLLLSGALDYADGAYQQAINRWRAVLNMAPMNLEARRLLGAALLRAGDNKGALAVLRPIALRGDADSYTLALVGRAFEANGERDWAATYLDRAAIPALTAATQFGIDDDLAQLRLSAEQAPANPIVQIEYLRGLLFRGQTAKALSRAQALARTYPGAPQAHLLVGDVMMALGRPEEASRAYARAADLRFDEPTMLRAVEALQRLRQRDKAATVVALYLAQNPGNIAARRLTAHWQIATGAWDDAIDTLEGLRGDLGNRDPALLAELAVAYAGSGEDEVAELYAANAYRLAPMNPAVVDSYGWALFQQEALPQAVELLTKAVSIAPRHALLRWHLAQALAESGDAAGARTHAQAALADPGFEDAAAARALLKVLDAKG